MGQHGLDINNIIKVLMIFYHNNWKNNQNNSKINYFSLKKNYLN